MFAFMFWVGTARLHVSFCLLVIVIVIVIVITSQDSTLLASMTPIDHYEVLVHVTTSCTL
jgi:hypothetical protein